MLLLRCVARSDCGTEWCVLNEHKGIFTALFLTTLWVLVNKSSTGRTSWPLVLIVCSMYLLAITVSSGYGQFESITGFMTEPVIRFRICLSMFTVPYMPLPALVVQM